MPPKGKAQPEAALRKDFLGQLSASLVKSDAERATADGRSTVRRMNRYEYENTVRDLLKAPWLQIKDKLPEDGEANRFNKVGDALDVSHVQMARYLTAADYALREVMADQQSRPSSKPVRYYARSEPSMVKKMFFSEFNRNPVRATFPVLGYAPQPDVRAGKAPATAGEKDAAIRDQEAIGWWPAVMSPLSSSSAPSRHPVPAVTSCGSMRMPCGWDRGRRRPGGSRIWMLFPRAAALSPSPSTVRLRRVCCACWAALTWAWSPPPARSTPTSSRGRPSAGMPCGSSAPAHRHRGIHWRKRTDSQGWPSSGWRWRAPCCRAGQMPGTRCSLKTCPRHGRTRSLPSRWNPGIRRMRNVCCVVSSIALTASL